MPPPDETLQRQLEAFQTTQRHSLTLGLVVRAIGFVYVVDFLGLFRQALPLLGSDGLLPVESFLNWVRQAVEPSSLPLLELPTLFWLDASDLSLQLASLLGVVLGALMLAGRANLPVILGLWTLQLSFKNVGQTFFGYGWEILLLEATTLCALVVPIWKPRPLRLSGAADLLPALLFRWLLFRLMFGAGLIKIQGDPCWSDLSCLAFHYETQPNPHPLSWLLHQAPLWFHQAGALTNHFVELVAPFGLFGPRKVRLAAGLSMLAFQVLLILSGNLSFLNWLTLAICIASFDDRALDWLLTRTGTLGRRLRARWSGALLPLRWPRLRKSWSIAWSVLVAGLSLDPISNFVSNQPRMNASYNRLHLVNSYGAFGTVHRVRHEVIVEGTLDPIVPEAEWRAYEFPCKPGAPNRPPCFVTPYHHRLQWQSWFASFGDPESEPWLVHLAYKILIGSPTASRLIAEDPFDGQPPRYVRARLFRYEFTGFSETGWWKRRPVGQWMRPVSATDPELLDFLRARGWLEDMNR